MDITENCTLKMKNVLSFRGKVLQEQVPNIMKELEEIIKMNAAKRNGPGVTATFGIENVGIQSIIDLEILIPLDRAIVTTRENFNFKPVFQLTKAVKIRHEGNPASLQNSGEILMQYIENHSLMPITPAYTVTVKEPQNTLDADDAIIDMYIGISDNIL